MKKLRFSPALMASLFILAISASGAAHAQTAHQPSTVVELYTSQGCSSCPPADELLGMLVTDEDILGLSFAVTYWDYIGWKDTFGTKENDARQSQYQKALDSRYVYTPQMVIDGREHVVGSDASGVKSLIEKYSGTANNLPLTWSFNGNKLEIHLPSSDKQATIWLVDLDRMTNVDIERGENTGKTVTYHNIVRNVRSLGEWDGTARTFELNLAEIRQSGRDGCAIIVQQAGYGPIFAALNISL